MEKNYIDPSSDVSNWDSALQFLRSKNKDITKAQQAWEQEKIALKNKGEDLEKLLTRYQKENDELLLRVKYLRSRNQGKQPFPAFRSINNRATYDSSSIKRFMKIARGSSRHHKTKSKTNSSHHRAKSDIPEVHLIDGNKLEKNQSPGGFQLGLLLERKARSPLSSLKNSARKKISDSLAGFLTRSLLYSNLNILKKGELEANELKTSIKKTHRRSWKVDCPVYQQFGVSGFLSKTQKNIKFSSQMLLAKSELFGAKKHQKSVHSKLSLKNFEKLRKLSDLEMLTGQKSQRAYKKWISAKKRMGNSMKSAAFKMKKVTSLKKILDFHLDSVRDIEFLDSNKMVSCSEDYTICIWNIKEKTNSSSLYPSIVTTTESPIFVLERDPHYFHHPSFFSGNISGDIYRWVYDGSSLVKHELAKLPDIIWNLQTNHKYPLLLSSSPDGCKLWNTLEREKNLKQIKTYDRFLNQVKDVPTCLKWQDGINFCVGYSQSCKAVLYDSSNVSSLKASIFKKSYTKEILI